MTYAGTCEIILPQLPSYFPTTGHVMPGFQDNLVGLGPMCDYKCTVTLSKDAVNIYSPNGNPLITGWREPGGHCLWHMYLILNP